jgi:hypothetical protein
MPYLFKSSEEENTAWRGALSARRRWKKQPQKAPQKPLRLLWLMRSSAVLLGDDEGLGIHPVGITQHTNPFFGLEPWIFRPRSFF